MFNVLLDMFVVEKCFVNCFRFKFKIKLRPGVLSRSFCLFKATCVVFMKYCQLQL